MCAYAEIIGACSLIRTNKAYKFCFCNLYFKDCSVVSQERETRECFTVLCAIQFNLQIEDSPNSHRSRKQLVLGYLITVLSDRKGHETRNLLPTIEKSFIQKALRRGDLKPTNLHLLFFRKVLKF